ncbi:MULTISPECIES: GNAT family N-acetyltransferase [unclassified Achromobacter]|uniref:GNAT family N-acetyltransferase n=1 Tax=unclassified Achromobacter TaxID=2626865 RepID=UPI000B515E8D|nr:MULTISPECIES: GNAT family N-acetyltransferase [unclassified Achromobacter]OWT74632.1 GNAT family N-acetyltransferase [Achromobacter sp. HZ34]OWT79099.1 GNAT family N-acetyltransferase [Achromobacter sp. HZ28]
MFPDNSAQITIRDAAAGDFVAIQAIYEHHVLHGTASFELTPPTAEELVQRHAGVLAARLPYLVALLDEVVVGYAYATLYRPRPAYGNTCEDSVYVKPGLAGHGIGGKLLKTLIERCTAGGWRQMLAVVGDSANAASLALHARCGFHPVGTLRSVGHKHGEWRDTVLMQRALGAGDTEAPTPKTKP